MRDWLPEFMCPLDEELKAAVGFCIVFGGFYAFIRSLAYLREAESHIDADHWAGLPADRTLAVFWNHCLRANTGLGYTAAGRKVWWQGYRYIVLTFSAFMLFIVFVLMSERYCT